MPESRFIMNLDLAIEQLRCVLRRQHKALSTESAYIFWLRRYVEALDKVPDSLSSEQKLEQFLSNLARHQDVAASTQNQALNAILYFYKEVLGKPLQGIDALRAKRPPRMRHAPTVAQTRAVLQSVPDISGYALCALCLHPIGYYGDTWAGVMCPTDEVIAHLLMMRGSEEKFWANANQHPLERPAAGV